jgi:hypothetical protein
MTSFHAKFCLRSTFHAVSQFRGPVLQMIVLITKCTICVINAKVSCNYFHRYKKGLSWRRLFVIIYRKYFYFVPSNGSGSWLCDKTCFVVSTYDGPVLIKWVTDSFTFICYVWHQNSLLSLMWCFRSSLVSKSYFQRETMWFVKRNMYLNYRN